MATIEETIDLKENVIPIEENMNEDEKWIRQLLGKEVPCAFFFFRKY